MSEVSSACGEKKKFVRFNLCVKINCRCITLESHFSRDGVNQTRMLRTTATISWCLKKKDGEFLITLQFKPVWSVFVEISSFQRCDALRSPPSSPLQDNLFEWHFSVRGPPDSDFDGGVYHGRIVLPPEYPMKPPSIILLTVRGGQRLQLQLRAIIALPKRNGEDITSNDQRAGKQTACHLTFSRFFLVASRVVTVVRIMPGLSPNCQRDLLRFCETMGLSY